MNAILSLALADPLGEKTSKRLSFFVLLVWAGVVLFVMTHHELWRDEAHCFYVALSADSLWQLPDAVKNEGHPILWYFLLWAGYHLIHTPLILKIVSLLIGFLAVAVFLIYSPFQTWFKVLFLFSFLPLYEYTVMARNYGISMLFFFLFVSLYSKKKEFPFRVALCLFALANTNIHSTIFVCFLLTLWLYQTIGCRKEVADDTFSFKQFLLPFGFVVMGIFLAVLTVIPDENSIVMQTNQLDLPRIIEAMIHGIVHPGSHFQEVFAGMPDFARDLIVFSLAAGLLIRPAMAILLYGGAVSLSTFFSIGYSGALRHQGIFFLYVLTLYWLTLLDLRKQNRNFKIRRGMFGFSLYGLLPLILLVHLVGSYKYVLRDVTQQMSSNKEFGLFIKTNDEYHDAIIMGEPDIRLESLPYYADNPIFVPRINRYEKFIKLIRDNKQVLTLGELHSLARSIQQREKKPVLIALGHFGLADQKPPFIRQEQYERKFTWTLEELERFKEGTVKIAEFKQDVKNERYEVYRLVNQ